ncbi:hypothetical protein Psta_0015 [Pirellula staleyi DSM 6068]|uniref:Uncharacterized protein n=1 Tax=Pirellula staleyi (strain ATCC 27377 / DSM 6068 / ICPB 4128) TaxID=530564 RepID=D2QZF4_PIRSD|nr:hypothetical protein Psta_0015 [Pirellula staleyi DSM 6068]
MRQAVQRSGHFPPIRTLRWLGITRGAAKLQFHPSSCRSYLRSICFYPVAVDHEPSLAAEPLSKPARTF